MNVVDSDGSGDFSIIALQLEAKPVGEPVADTTKTNKPAARLDIAAAGQRGVFRQNVSSPTANIKPGYRLRGGRVGSRSRPANANFRSIITVPLR